MCLQQLTTKTNLYKKCVIFTVEGKKELNENVLFQLFKENEVLEKNSAVETKKNNFKSLSFHKTEKQSFYISYY